MLGEKSWLPGKVLTFRSVLRIFSMDKYKFQLVGIIRVPAADLNFMDSREVDIGHINRLVQVFQDTGCKPDNSENHIHNLLSETQLQNLLRKSNITREDLSQTLAGRSLTLRELQGLPCIGGQHRIAATKIFPGPDTCWTVRLHTSQQHHVENHLDCNKYLFQSQFSDGEIFYRIWTFTRAGQFRNAHIWESLLLICKRRILE